MSRLVLDDGWVDLDSGAVARGEGGSLTATELRLVACLADANGSTVPKDQLIARVWGPDAGAAVLEKTVQRVRARIEAEPKRPKHLLTVHGSGYRLVARTEEPAADLVGRDAEIARVRAALSESGARVVLLGPGGIGKTALARAVVAAVPHVFADLSGVTGEVQVLAAIAGVLGLSAGVRTIDDARHAIRAALSRGTLLVLDDAEAHVAALSALLEVCHGAAGRILVTSRARLDRPDETVIEVRPLPLADARRLFEQKSRHSSLSDELLERLDGHPLAIELAAAWARRDPASLASRVAVLDLPGEMGPERHGSMRAVVASSVTLLDPAHRRALQALSCFAGTFDLEGATAVLAPDAIPAVERLQTLVDHSLVGRTTRRGQRRLQLSGPVRRYLADVIPGSRDEAAFADARGRWERFLVARGERLLGQGRRAMLELDLDDLVEVVRAADGEIAVRASVCAHEICRVKGAVSLGTQIAERAVEASRSAAPRWRAAAYRELAFARRSAGRFEEAEAAARMALSLADLHSGAGAPPGDGPGPARRSAGPAADATADARRDADPSGAPPGGGRGPTRGNADPAADARTDADPSRAGTPGGGPEAADPADATTDAALSHKTLALVLHLRGKNAEAEQEALAALRLARDPTLAARCRADLAVVRAALGTVTRADLHEVLAAFLATADAEGEARVRVTIAQHALEQGDAPTAEEQASRALDLARTAELAGLAGVCMATLAMTAWERGDLDLALSRGIEAGDHLERIGAGTQAVAVRVWTEVVRAVRGDPASAEASLRAFVGRPGAPADLLALIALVRVARGLPADIPDGPHAPIVRWAITREGPPPPATSGEWRRLVRWLGYLV